MSESIVAYRYAKALIDLAVEQNVVNEMFDDMKFFETVCEENDEFTAVMRNPIVRHDKKKNILKNIFENKVNKVTFEIFDVLTRKNRESLLFPIAKEFNKLYLNLKGIQKATVTTVEPLSEAQRKEFTKIVADATSKEVELVEKIDASLIGGYVLSVGDTQIDSSIKKKLNELKLEMA